MCFVTFLLGTSICPGAQSQETPEEHLGRLVKEAAGKQEIHASASPKQNAFDDAFRSGYRALIQANKNYELAVKKVPLADIKQLGTPPSLSNPASAESGLLELSAEYKAEVEHEQNVERIYANIKHILETAEWTAPIRTRLLKIFDRMTVAPALQRQRCIASEKVWIDALNDLYVYSTAHTTELHLIDGVIMIDDPSTRSQFNEKILVEATRRRLFLKTRADYAQIQTAALGVVKVDRNDIGLR